MNAARRLWEHLTAGNSLRHPGPVGSRRGDADPQMWLEHRHSWQPDILLSGKAWTCSVCGFTVPATSPVTYTGGSVT